MQALTPATQRLLDPIRFTAQDRLYLALDKAGKKFHASTFSVGFNGNAVAFPSYHAQKTFWTRFPERKSIIVSEMPISFELGATDISAHLISHLWPASQMVVEKDARVVLDYLIETTNQHQRNSEAYANYKEHGTVPAFEYEKHEDPDLHLAPYQEVALYNAVHSEGYAEFMEQGTGKTPIVIARVMHDAAKLYKETGRAYRGIIVCPKQVRRNWEEEFAKFATRSGRVVALRGTAINRLNDMLDAFSTDEDDEYTILICTYGALIQQWNKGLSWVDWDLAVLDESHAIKTQSTKRAKFCRMLRDKSARRMVLTGTPITNTPLDLYSQLEFLGEGWSGFLSWETFKNFYGVFEKSSETGFKQLVALQNMPFLQERLARLSFIIRKEEALPNLPEKVRDIYEVEMTADQTRIYNEVALHLMSECEEILGGEHKQLVVNNVLTKLLRLSQITSGFITYSKVCSDEGEVLEPAKIEWLKTNPKLDALVELLQDKGPNEKTLIWACWIPDILAISARFKELGWNHVTYHGATSDKARDEAVYRFNHDRGCTLWVGNPAAGGAGLNLLGYPPSEAEAYDTNCNHIVYYSENWSPTARSQSEDRPHRRGTRESVRVTDLCVPNTIDEEIRTRVCQKIATALEISDIREILRNVLRGVK